MPDDHRRPRPINNRRHNPLDDLLTDTEIRAESQKFATRFATGNTRAKRHILRTTPFSVIGFAALLLVTLGIVVGQQFAQRADTQPLEKADAQPNESLRSIVESRLGNSPQVVTPTEPKIEVNQFQAKVSADVAESLPPITQATTERAIAAEPVPQSPMREGASLIDQTRGSVVHIEVTKNARGSVRSSGSGFFIQDDSSVATNFHVIDGAYSASVVLKDGTRVNVVGVEGLDAAADLAVLKLVPDTNRVIRPLNLGPNTPPQVLSDVFVIGSPYRQQDTVTQGKVSNNNREREGRSRLQIDASINFGSSGCPVLNSDGSVVGIAYAGVPGTRINFAVHVADLTSLLNSSAEFQKLSELFVERQRLLNSERAKLQREVGAVTDEVIEFVKGLRPSFQHMPEYSLLKGATFSELAKREAMVARHEAKQENLKAAQEHRRSASNYWRRARYEFRQALEIDPSESQAWYEIGNTLLIENRQPREQKDALDAVNAFRSGTQANQNDGDCWHGLGIAILSLRFEKKPEEAVEALRRAIAINPQDAPSHAALGDALLELRKPDDARASYKVALTLKPEDYVCQFGYGFFLRRLEQYDTAIAAFEKALKLSNDSEIRRADCEEEIEKTRRLIRR